MPTVEASQPASRLGERNRMMSLRPSAQLDAQGCAQLTVRPAIADDMSYLLDAFEYALSPYYGGDHVAHAHRVIQTHLDGGTDPRGLLSARQLVLILWEGGRRRGVLNLVFKRQATCKISPLILYPADHRRRGLGTILLQAAEREACNVGARQLYCTVARSNRSTLSFFMQLGFILCGQAYEQYKEGEMEILLRRPIVTDPTDYGLHDLISVAQVHGDNAWNDVSKLFLHNLDQLVEGAGYEWLEKLRHGSDESAPSARAERREAWVYAARDRAGQYRAAAIVTSKKGGSLKVMPIAASDPAGFRALIIDLPGLLAGNGRKAYLHHTPSSREVAALQESSWCFEAQLPGAYHEDVVTQQWGCPLGEKAPMKNLRIQDPYLHMIAEGQKSLEIRVAYEHMRDIKAGNDIKLESDSHHLICSVADVRQYPSLEAMLQHENIEKALPGVSTGKALQQLRRIYPPEKERLGIIVLELTQCAS